MKKVIFTAAILTLFLSACGNSEKPLTKEERIIQYSKVTEKKVDPLYGKEIGFWYGAINGARSNGVGFIHKFESGTTTATVNLNIEIAPEKKYYVAWLRDEDAVRTVKVGVLESIVSDARHSASLTTKENLDGLLNVIVSLESTNNPEKPSDNVEAKGTLRKVQKPAD